MKTSLGGSPCQDMGQRVPGGRAEMPRRQTRTPAKETDTETKRQ